jgi:transketolase
VAWKAVVERKDGPGVLALSRQNLAPQKHTPAHAQLAARGGYILVEPEKAPEAVVIATGSEVELAVQGAKVLAGQGRAVRVVSMPCLEVFLAQEATYREQVLPAALQRRLVVEAGVSALWQGLAGPHGAVLGVDDFGASAPAAKVFAQFGLTVDGVAQKLRNLLT